MKCAPEGTEHSAIGEDRAILLRNGVPISEGESGMWLGPGETGVNWGTWNRGRMESCQRKQYGLRRTRLLEEEPRFEPAPGTWTLAASHRKRALPEAGQEAQTECGSGTEKREVMGARGKADFMGIYKMRRLGRRKGWDEWSSRWFWV